MTTPAPLTPAGLDLRDFSWLPLDVVMLENSETWALAGALPYARGACINLWARAWHQVPAASLPDNEALLAKWADVPDWNEVREIAMRGFVECTDGRLYHRVLAKAALKAKETRDKASEARELKRKNLKAWRERKRQEKQQTRSIQGDVSEASQKPLRNALRPYLTKPDQTRPIESVSGSGLSGKEKPDSGADPLFSPDGAGEQIDASEEADVRENRTIEHGRHGLVDDHDLFSDPINGLPVDEYLKAAGIPTGARLTRTEGLKIASYSGAGMKKPIEVTRPDWLIGPWPNVVP